MVGSPGGLSISYRDSISQKCILERVYCRNNVWKWFSITTGFAYCYLCCRSTMLTQTLTCTTLRHHLPSGGKAQGETGINKEIDRQMDLTRQTDRPLGKDTTHRGVNGLDIYYMVTMDRCWICDWLPTVCQPFKD